MTPTTQQRQGRKPAGGRPSSNRDLLIIAVLSGIGGVMSTYVGYLGNLLNRLCGVPFGAGQFVAGLHVIWIILVADLVRWPAAATAAGLLKGVVELLTGSTHGVAIVLVSLTQGLVVDIVLLVARRRTAVTYAIAGGLATASNVFVFQALYFSGAPWGYLLFIGALALASGILLAGCFGTGILDIIRAARPVRLGPSGSAAGGGGTRQPAPGRLTSRANLIATGLLVLVLSAGAVYYFAAVYEPPWAGPQCRVEGNVDHPLVFELSRFQARETTITTELRGQVTYVPPQDYRGVPLHVILEQAGPRPDAATLRVIASDGYEVEFPLQDVVADERMLLARDGDSYRLIAAEYAGGYWVKQVARLVVE